MSFKVENMEEKNMVKLVIEATAEEFEAGFNKNKNKISVPGFRKGKAPRKMVEKLYGTEIFYEDAANAIIPDAYAKAADESELEIVSQPKINVVQIEAGKPFIFEAVVAVKPEVELGQYKGVEVEKCDTEVTDADVEEELKKVQDKNSRVVTVEDRAVKNGDMTTIDFEGFVDGVAFEGGSGENYPLELGSGSFIPGFEEQLIGLKAGDEKDIKVTFPEDYASEELKGQEAVFKIKVHEVKTKELPEMDEEFFKDLGYEGVETEEQLKDLVKADLEAKQEYELENKYVDDLLEEAAKHTIVDLPEELVHEEIHRMMHQYEENLKMQGITLDMFYQFTNSTEEDLEKQMHPEAEKRVKYRFMLEEIATLEKVEVTDEEANKEAEDLAKKYNTTKEELLNQIGGLDALKYEVEMQKVIEILKK